MEIDEMGAGIHKGNNLPIREFKEALTSSLNSE